MRIGRDVPCSWRVAATRHREGAGANSAEHGSMGECILLQLKSAKQLSVGSYDDGGQAHRDGPYTHREIESPVDEEASSDRNSDNVIRRRPNQVLDHFSIGSAG
jgi:hypothetical protein